MRHFLWVLKVWHSRLWMELEAIDVWLVQRRLLKWHVSLADVFLGIFNYLSSIIWHFFFTFYDLLRHIFDVCYHYIRLVFGAFFMCHSWMSFSGFSEAFNEVHDLKTVWYIISVRKFEYNYHFFSLKIVSQYIM